ncbi:hypothetical protein MTO96_014897 [Rhipicephalus appendiculatus]
MCVNTAPQRACGAASFVFFLVTDVFAASHVFVRDRRRGWGPPTCRPASRRLRRCNGGGLTWIWDTFQPPATDHEDHS